MRKQVYDLTEEDLAVHPVWEFALDEEGEVGQDEATVRPVAFAGVDHYCIVRATFTLANGATFPGYCSPAADASDLGRVQPVVITPAGQVVFWLGVVEPTKAQLNEMYARLGSERRDAIFPVRFKTTAGLEMSGTVPGFLLLVDYSTMKTRVLP